MKREEVQGENEWEGRGWGRTKELLEFNIEQWKKFERLNLC